MAQSDLGVLRPVRWSLAARFAGLPLLRLDVATPALGHTGPGGRGTSASPATRPTVAEPPAGRFRAGHLRGR